MDRKCATIIFLSFSLVYLVAYRLEKWSTQQAELTAVIDVRPPSSAGLAASRIAPAGSGSRIILPKQKRSLLFPDHDTLPHHEYLMSSEELKNTTWVADLHDYLMTLNRNVSPHVNLVFADYKHRILVANWVVAATLKVEPPLHNVLVLSLDQLLCNFLVSSMLYMKHPPDITCIAAPVDTMLSSKGDNLWKASMMIRPIILRLINYWGYDVATYDSDAVVLKNPQTLFEKYTHDILSSASMWPDSQAKPWGFTLCAGAILYRASSATGWVLKGKMTVYLGLSLRAQCKNTMNVLHLRKPMRHFLHNNVCITICNSRYCVVDHE